MDFFRSCVHLYFLIWAVKYHRCTIKIYFYLGGGIGMVDGVVGGG